MALREAGIRLTLQGAAEYRAGLKGISQELKTMATQSKLAMAQLGNNPTLTQRYKTGMKSLNDELRLNSQRTEMVRNRQRELNREYPKLSQSVEKANRAWQDSVKETDRLKNNYQQMSQALGQNHEQTKKAKEAWQNQKQVTADLKREYAGLSKELQVTERELAKLPNELARNELQTQRNVNAMQRLHDEYRNAGGVLNGFASGAKKMGQTMVNTGQRISKAGDWMTTRFTAPIAAKMGLAVREASRFQTEMGTLLPLIAEGGNITAEHRQQVEELGRTSRRLAIDYGQHTSEINQGMAELIRNGYTAQQVMGMVPNILDASIASGEDFNTVMHTTANVMSQFQLRGNDMNETLANTQRVVDSLTYVANATSSGFYDLGEGMAYVGPIANTLNMSVEETASILGILSDNGIEASKGGTALRGALTRLLKPSKQNAEAMAALGISTEDYKNGLIGFPEILDKIAENTKNLTDEQKAALIAQAFGTEAQSAMNALVNAGGDALREMTKEAQNATGATKEMAEAIKQTPEFKFERALAQLRDVSIEIGSKLLPIVTDGVSAIGDFAEGFTNLSDGTQDFIVKSALAAATIGPLLSGFGRIVSVSGHVVTVVGKVAQAIGKMITPKSVTGVSGFASALSSINPIAIGVVGTLGVLAGAYLLVNSEAAQAYRRMQEFPDISNLSEAQAQSLRSMSDEVVSLGVELDTLNTASNFDNLQGSLQGLAGEIDRLNSDRINELRENFKALPSDVQESLSGALEQAVSNIESQTSRVQEVMDEINRLTKQGLDENGVLQNAYVQQVQALTDELFSYYALALSENEQQYQEIYGNLTQDISQMTKDGLDQRLKYIEGAMTQEKDLYQQQRDALFQMRREKAISEEEYYSDLADIQAAHNSRMTVLNEEYIRSSAEAHKRLHEEMRANGIDTEQAYKGHLQTLAEDFGLTMEEVEAIVDGVDLTEPVKNMAKATKDATPQIKTAVDKWNSAMLDFAHQAGKAVEDLNQNDLQQFVENIRETGMTWEELEFVAKNAEIDENLRQFIEDYVEAQGGWEALKLEEKKAEVTVSGEEELERIIELFGGEFAGLSDEKKQALVEAEGAKELSDLLVDYGLWAGTSPIEAKQAVIETDQALSALKPLLIELDLWNSTEFLGKYADIDTNAPEAAEKIAQLIAEWSGLSIDEVKKLMTETNASETSSELETLGSTADSLSERPIVFRVQADGTVAAKGDIESLRQATADADGTTATVHANAETSTAQANIDSMKQSIDGVPESKTTSLGASILESIMGGLTLGAYRSQIESIPESKSTTISVESSGVAEAQAAITGYNLAASSMLDKSVTASTSTPGMPTNTTNIRDYNTHSGQMRNTNATATTNTPGLPGNTNLVQSWNVTTNQMQNRTSTATTLAPGISGNTSAVWGWISALNSTYSTSSTLTTYVDTVYRTFGSPGRRFAEGGHIGAFADGGNIKWGGMFANGGNVPKGFMGIVGEAGPELFHVTNSGVSITPLNASEKMRGVEGAIADYMKNKGGSIGSGAVNFNIEINNPVVREEQDITRIAEETSKQIMKVFERDNKTRKGSAVGFA